MDRDNVPQIKIGRHRFGIVGLKKALENMAEAYAEQADDLVAEELLNRLSKKNYIPEKMQKIIYKLEVILWENVVTVETGPILSQKVENLLSLYIVPMVER